MADITELGDDGSAMALTPAIKVTRARRMLVDFERMRR
jgi:hypothetical protein